MPKKILITETPDFNFEVKYGLDNRIVITQAVDLFGYGLRFIVYKEMGLPKILEISLGTKLSFLTFIESSITKTRIFLQIDKTDSMLIPTIKAPLKNLCEDVCLVPTCYYDLIGTISGEDVPIIKGFIQGTPTGKGAI
jgi:hypothetical protein